MGRYIVSLAIAGGLLSGSCSSTADFTAPELKPVPIAIPVPPAERVCRDIPALKLADLLLEQVEADGSTFVIACTQDILELIAQIMQEQHECQAHNEARAVVIEAERIAREELERLRGE